MPDGAGAHRPDDDRRNRHHHVAPLNLGRRPTFPMKRKSTIAIKAVITVANIATAIPWPVKNSWRPKLVGVDDEALGRGQRAATSEQPDSRKVVDRKDGHEDPRHKAHVAQQWQADVPHAGPPDAPSHRADWYSVVSTVSSAAPRTRNINGKLSQIFTTQTEMMADLGVEESRRYQAKGTCELVSEALGVPISQLQLVIETTTGTTQGSNRRTLTHACRRHAGLERHASAKPTR